MYKHSIYIYTATETYRRGFINHTYENEIKLFQLLNKIPENTWLYVNA